MTRFRLIAAAIAVSALLGVGYWAYRSQCDHLYFWEMPRDCQPETYSTCDWTPACRPAIEDAESRELSEDLERWHTRHGR